MLESAMEKNKVEGGDGVLGGGHEGDTVQERAH